MNSNITVTLLRGAIFGMGLTLSGVGNPQVIRDQFRLADFHMLVTFLTASASSAAIFAVHNLLQSTKNTIPHRSNSSYGWFGNFDGNIIGGAMVGLGMSLTGACPGTVLVQAVAGTAKSRLLVGSAILAGVAWVKWKSWFLSSRTCQTAPSSTIMAATGWTAKTIIVGYEVVMIAAIGTVLAIAPRGSTLLHPIVGGLLIGFAQLASVVLSNKPVGVSTAYEECGELFWDTTVGKHPSKVPSSILFAGGMMAGSALTMFVVPATREALVSSPEPASGLMTIVGGSLLSFGARIAGGCTSGHGISGMATMSLSSIVTVASMFGTGLLSGLLLR